MRELLFRLASVAFLAATAFAETEVAVRNAGFAEGVDAGGVPAGWSVYGGRDAGRRIAIVEDGGADKAVLIDDGDPSAEVGLTQVVPIAPDTGYELRVRVRAVPGASAAGAHAQLRFLPSGTYEQVSLQPRRTDGYEEIAVQSMAPPGTRAAQIYLYTHRGPTPKVLIGGVRLVSGVRPSQPPPAPVPPQYASVKDLCLTTHLVRDGRPTARIVAPKTGVYQAQASRIQAAVQGRTGCLLPVIADDAPEAAVPISGNLVVLGNRSTNATISELYNRYFLLTDLRYPGTGGHEVRTLHNPCGGGHNVIVVGGSDATGVDRATDAMIAALRRARGPTAASLSVDWLMEIKLGDGMAVPRDVREMETWEASAGYRSVGYFGWNSISKRMAAYYMSGDPFHAREALRLAFPDRRAFGEIAEIDEERIENKEDPLAGPYHYNAHLMILFWDLIEESPVFSDTERLRVTNAFARQLAHRKDEGVYGLTRAPSAVGSRHGQWSAISLYCLGRYFQRDYPDPIWEQCLRGARLHFAPLEESAWINGESDNLFWYCTGIAPVFTHMLLSGERAPMRNAVAAALLRGQEVLISGRVPDWALRSAAIDYLHKVAYLTHDGRWLTYRDRTGIDTNVVRLGQSFWPEESIRPVPPSDLVGRWTIHPLPEPHWRSRGNGFPKEESFYNASFRSAADGSGDFVLVDGFNGASRNPYHTFSLLELRLAGQTILEGYLNQVQTRADGMVEPRVAMDAALRRADVLGGTAICVGETPGAAFCNWRRTLVQRIGRYALVADDIAFRRDSENMEIQIGWQNTQRPFRPDPARNALSLGGDAICAADPFAITARGPTGEQQWRGAVRKDARRAFFALIGKTGSVECARLADNAAALALPQRAVCVAGEWEDNRGDLVVLAENHVVGVGLLRADGDRGLLVADEPIDLEWDFAEGRAEFVARGPTKLTASVAKGVAPQGDNAAVLGQGDDVGTMAIQIRAGRTTIRDMRPPDAMVRALGDQLRARVGRAVERGAPAQPASAPVAVDVPRLAGAWTTQLGGPIDDVILIVDGGRELIAAAAGATIHLLGEDGKEIGQLRTDGAIRQMHWWPEHALLLAGCSDEKVCAFDLGGNRRWTFVSEMDPAVFRAGKQYWFKTAPGHGGIHGVGSGVFLDGKSQAFVGSACTLEILDEKGHLLKRLPQFWGTVCRFAVVPAADGSTNLLASRKITDVPSLGIINSRTLDPAERGFLGVPPGHSQVGGWMDQTRHHILVDDLDADGTREVISEITGAWNRVTVWDLGGKPIHNVQFGPGSKGPGRDIRDIDIGDLDGDEKKEIVVGLSSGLVVTLDHRCEKRWSRRAASPPVVLGVAGGQIVVASEDGGVAMLDRRGDIIARARVNGRPAHLQRWETMRLVAIATDKGEVHAFSIEPRGSVK